LTFKNKELPKNNAQLIKNKITYIKLFNKYLLEGGFPEYVLTNNENLLKTYFDDIIYKDVAIRHNIRSLNLLRKLANFCVTNISSPISYNSLKNTFKVSLDLIRSYLEYLEEAYLLFTIPIFSYSLKVQEQNPRKIYVIDNGLRNSVSFKFSKDLGKLAENLTFIELKRQQKEIYYWKNNGEIDFVIKNKDDSLDLINVCYSENSEIPEREINSLLEFKENYKSIKINKSIILTKDFESKNKDILFIPLWKWLLLSK